VGAMRKATRQIVTNTNSQLHSPTFTPTQASTFVQSGASQYFPVSTPGAAPGAKDVDPSIAAMQALATKLNNFAAVCVRPQPSTTSAFDACTKFSPDAPPPASITTTLASTTVTLNAGDPLSFIATSQPSGTPWAMYASNGGIAQQYLGDLHQVTLSPSQTQVTLHYGATAVPTDTDVALSLATLGGTGSATTVTLKLKAAAAAAPAAAGTTRTDASPDFAKLKADAAVIALPTLTSNSSGDQVKADLGVKYRALCGAPASTDAKLQDVAFIKAIDSKAKPDANAAFCK